MFYLFDSIFYNKYLIDDHDALEETNLVTSILNNCKSLDLKSINKTNDVASVFFNNIDGVTSNFDRLHTELSTLKNQFSVITLAETNIDSTHKDLFKLPGYQSVFQSKILHKHKGSGLGIYLNENFVFDTLAEHSQCSRDIESLFIKITNTSQPLTVGVVYRPPNGNIVNFLMQFENLLESLPDSNVIITGDFNINLHQPINVKEFENRFFGHGFVPIISLATHFKPGCNPSCIDNIFVNTPGNIIISGVSENTISHHHPIFCLYQAECEKSLNKKLYCQNMTTAKVTS